MIKILTDVSAEAILQKVNTLAGNLSSLNTATKTSLVAAINEVLANEGALSSLTTGAKTTLVAAVNELQALTSPIAEARALGNAGHAHNLIYRGKCLGDKPTAAQLAAIADGTFDDMYLGDYWTGVGNSGWTGLHWMIVHFNYYKDYDGNSNVPHLTVMQMKSASASEARNIARIPDWTSGKNIVHTLSGMGFEQSGASYDTGKGGYIQKVTYNALRPTFGTDHVMPQWGPTRMINNATGLPNGRNTDLGCYARAPFYSQLLGEQMPSSDGKIHISDYTGNTYGDHYDRLLAQWRQFAAFKACPIWLTGCGKGSEHSVFWLSDLIGPNSSGVPLGLLGCRDWGGIFTPKAITYSDQYSTYHMYASIK